jgi:hypothetical protein
MQEAIIIEREIWAEELGEDQRKGAKEVLEKEFSKSHFMKSHPGHKCSRIEIEYIHIREEALVGRTGNSVPNGFAKISGVFY